jgi:hypothetical protein
MEISIPTDYKYLLSHYPKEYLLERFLFWRKRCKNFISKTGIDQAVHIDNDSLIFMILSYFADIVRLKEFHPNVDTTRRVTNFAYSFYWFLRSKPIQLVHGVQQDKNRSSFINEKFIAAFWVSEFVGPLKIEKGLRDRYLKELVYFFKYRNYNAQSLEAILTALLLGGNQNPFYDGPKPPINIHTITRAACLDALANPQNNPDLAQRLDAQIGAIITKHRCYPMIEVHVSNDFEEVVAEQAIVYIRKWKPPNIEIVKAKKKE